MTDAQAEALRPTNNPTGEPTGHFTGRCGRCASTALWDDNSAYGCNTCGEFWTGIEPRLVPNGNAILPRQAKAWVPLPTVPAPDLDDMADRAREAINRTVIAMGNWARANHQHESARICKRMDDAIHRHARTTNAILHRLDCKVSYAFLSHDKLQEVSP